MLWPSPRWAHHNGPRHRDPGRPNAVESGTPILPQSCLSASAAETTNRNENLWVQDIYMHFWFSLWSGLTHCAEQNAPFCRKQPFSQAQVKQTLSLYQLTFFFNLLRLVLPWNLRKPSVGWWILVTSGIAHGFFLKQVFHRNIDDGKCVVNTLWWLILNVSLI